MWFGELLRYTSLRILGEKEWSQSGYYIIISGTGAKRQYNIDIVMNYVTIHYIVLYCNILF